MGPSRIPLSDVYDYLDDHEVNDPDDRDDFIELLQSMDNAYIDIQAKAAEQARGNR